MKKSIFAITGVLVCFVLVVLLIIFAQRLLQPSGSTNLPSTVVPSPSQAGRCDDHTAIYHVAGKRILDDRGQQFIPYGVQLEGILLAQTNWRTDAALTHLTSEQVQAARNFWHSNTVSLQLSSRSLFDQSPYDSTYLAAVDQTVSWATHLGMNILLILQYEGAGNSEQPLPTEDTVHFWDIVSRHYARNTSVFFDIFNEPNPATLIDHSDTDRVWNLWQNGGRFNGTTYIGFQQLVYTIRNTGAQNLIFADGVAAGEDIRLLPKHLLNGCNIVYAIHPYFNATQHRTSSEWDSWFGNVATTGNFPVVADEWSEYQSNRGECLPNASTVVPLFLAYLKSHGIGLIAYALAPGLLIRGWDFRDPTAFDQPTYICTQTVYVNLDPHAQGAGQFIQQYFAQNSV